MSYDLMVFEAKKAPRTREAFMEWYGRQTEWSEDHGYDDPAVCSPALRGWIMEMKETFRPMNGPLSPSDEEFEGLSEEEEDHLTDYSMGRDIVYAAFAWSLAGEARERTRCLAIKHGTGFFDVSGERGEILFPDGTVL